MNPMQRKILFWAALAFAFIMAVVPRPPTLPGEPSDKLQHIVAFATLAILAFRAWPAASRLRIAVQLSLFGALIEVVQAIPTLYRDSDWHDWVADTGAVLAVLLAWRWLIVLMRRAQPG